MCYETRLPSNSQVAEDGAPIDIRPEHESKLPHLRRLAAASFVFQVLFLLVTIIICQPGVHWFHIRNVYSNPPNTGVNGLYQLDVKLDMLTASVEGCFSIDTGSHGYYDDDTDVTCKRYVSETRSVFQLASMAYTDCEYYYNSYYYTAYGCYSYYSGAMGGGLTTVCLMGISAFFQILALMSALCTLVRLCKSNALRSIRLFGATGECCPTKSCCCWSSFDHPCTSVGLSSTSLVLVLVPPIMNPLLDMNQRIMVNAPNYNLTVTSYMEAGMYLSIINVLLAIISIALAASLKDALAPLKQPVSLGGRNATYIIQLGGNGNGQNVMPANLANLPLQFWQTPEGQQTAMYMISNPANNNMTFAQPPTEIHNPFGQPPVVVSSQQQYNGIPGIPNTAVAVNPLAYAAMQQSQQPQKHLQTMTQQQPQVAQQHGVQQHQGNNVNIGAGYPVATSAPTAPPPGYTSNAHQFNQTVAPGTASPSTPAYNPVLSPGAPLPPISAPSPAIYPASQAGTPGPPQPPGAGALGIRANRPVMQLSPMVRQSHAPNSVEQAHGGRPGMKPATDLNDL